MNEAWPEGLQAFLQFFNVVLNIFFRGGSFMKTITDVDVHEHLELADEAEQTSAFLDRFYTRMRCGKAFKSQYKFGTGGFGNSLATGCYRRLICRPRATADMIRDMKLARLFLLASLMVTAMVTAVATAWAQAASQAPTSREVEAVYPDAHALYLALHENPEISPPEMQTAAKLGSRWRSLGYEVTEHVGGTGVVALLKNGAGPTVMLRTELDALPVEEKTGLAYASKVKTKDDAGHDVPVMHACGHDLHMASILGTASIMAHSKDSWHGTLMLIGQPAEETIAGAKGMLDDGLLKRFPRPDVAVAMHVGNTLLAGQVGIVLGIYNTNADSLRITIYGKGGHGSAPHTAIDPIVIAARTILALQTIASRETKPGDMAVVTVGFIHAGTKNNIIPDQAELGLTVRTNKTEVRKRVLASIERITRAEAEAAGAPRPPTVDRYEGRDLV